MNRKECYELAHWVISKARKYGASDAAVNVYEQRQIEVEFRDKNIEKLQEAKRHSMNVSIYRDNRRSSQTTNDLRKESLEKFIEEAVSATQYLNEDPFRKLPDPKYYEGREKRDLELRDPSYEALTSEQRIESAREAADSGAAVSSRIVSATSGFSDSLSLSVKVHSNGFEGDQETTSFSLYANPTVKDDEGKLVEDFAYANTRYRENMPDPKKIGIEATERAVRRLGQKKANSEVMDLVVDRESVPQILNALIGPMSGSSLQQKRSFLEGRLGQKIASEKLTVTDDPFIVRGQGSRLFDGEGITARRMPVIEKGILKTYYIDNYYGRKLGMEPTTGGTSNLVFEYGSKSADEIIKGVSRGIFVTGFIGGNSNGTTGDFSFGIYGFAIENGVLAKPVCEMNVSGNMKDFWNKLADVGNDPNVYSGWRTPTLRFEEVQFSGL